MLQKAIAAFALEEERFDFTLPNCDLVPIVTGLGKTKAAASLTKAIMETNPVFVINVGTAGSRSRTVDDVVVGNHFFDRDREKLKDFGAEYEIATKIPDILPASAASLSKLGAVLGNINTGDDFVTSANLPNCDAIDMEAFALAYCCKMFNLPFVSVKCITDIVGKNSIKHWENKIADAKDSLKTFFNKIGQMPQ